MDKIKERRNEEPEEELEGIISGYQAIKRLKPPFHIWIRLKNILKEMRPLTYERNSEAEITLENLKANRIQIVKDWLLVVRHPKLYLPSQQKHIDQYYPVSSSQ